VIKKRGFGRKRPAPTDMALQITSMADIFMILLVFLLKNYSASLTTISPNAVMALPEQKANANATIKDTLKVEIAQDVVMVDQKAVTRLNNFEFAESDQGDFGTSESVAAALKDQRKITPNPNVDSTLIVMADEKAPYSTIKRVIASAAQAGFVDLQLVVIEPE
jgi:biopolymer transport protein ExbD